MNTKKTPTVIGKNLETALAARGLSQAEFARQLGVQRATVNHWISGLAFPSLEYIIAVADELGCSIDDLFIPDAFSGRRRRKLWDNERTTGTFAQ